MAVSHLYGPAYVRLARERTPILTTESTPFIPGRAYELWAPKTGRKVDVTIIGAGPILYHALLAARALEKEKISSLVLNLHTIKPIDDKKIVEVAKRAGRVVTVEEHQIMGGVGSAIAEVLAREYPVPIEFVGVNDQFGRSGPPDELIRRYNLDEHAILSAAHRLLKRR